MKLLGWILIGLPALLVVVLFALSNREPVSLGIWPLEMQWQVPLYLVVLGVGAVAFLLGASLGWISALRQRIKASHDRRRLDGLGREQAAWHERGRLEAEQAYRAREEDRYARAVQGRPGGDGEAANDSSAPKNPALPAVR